MEIVTENPFRREARPASVLLVDDDHFMRAIVKMALKGSKYAFAAAENADEALRSIGTQQPDIVLTDAMMPGASGFDLINALKGRPETSAMPIVLLTSLENPDGSVRDSSGKADFRLAKPFKAQELLSTLEAAEQLIDQRRVAA